MSVTHNIFLIGPMGAGKTTVGRRLARLRDMDFADSDHELEKRTGVDIPLIFEYEGEAGFRKRESDMLAELVARSGIVLATGGGAVLSPANRELLQAHGTVVYLAASVAQQLKRTRRKGNRPLLQTENPRAKLEALMRERDPLYNEIADVVVNTGNGRPQGTVRRIDRALSRLKEGAAREDSDERT